MLVAITDTGNTRVMIVLVVVLTRVKDDLADKYPPGREAQLDAHPLADAVVQLNADVARVLEYVVLHVRVVYRLVLEVPPADRERYYCLRKDLPEQNLNDSNST